MTQLYRIAYERKGQICGVTFSAPDAVSAADFSELWEKTCGCPVLTLKPLGVSKVLTPPWERWEDLSQVKAYEQAAKALNQPKAGGCPTREAK